jgi:hypothetical protein
MNYHYGLTFIEFTILYFGVLDSNKTNKLTEKSILGTFGNCKSYLSNFNNKVLKVMWWLNNNLNIIE